MKNSRYYSLVGFLSLILANQNKTLFRALFAIGAMGFFVTSWINQWAERHD